MPLRCLQLPTLNSLTPSTVATDPLVVFTDMVTLLVDQGALSPDVVDSPESPQYQALEWLSLDPNFYDYSEERATQRYVLAVMATSLQPVGAGRRRLELGGWMDYTDECTWFSSSSSAVCNDAGLYRTIDIQDIELDGELPAEIALLSNSLTSINMDRNNLQGQIPAEFGDLSLLEVLSLRQNSLDGFLTTSIGLLENLSILDLGRNDLSGEIPAEIGWMRSLRVLALDNNRFTGEIPRDIGDLSENLGEYRKEEYLEGILSILYYVSRAHRIYIVLSLVQSNLRSMTTFFLVGCRMNCPDSRT